MLAGGFTEVETPVLKRLRGADAEPFTRHNALDADFYLRISWKFR